MHACVRKLRVSKPHRVARQDPPPHDDRTTGTTHIPSPLKTHTRHLTHNTHKTLQVPHHSLTHTHSQLTDAAAMDTFTSTTMAYARDCLVEATAKDMNHDEHDLQP